MGFVLLISYNLFLIQSISYNIATIAMYGNLIYGYSYFPVLFYLYFRSIKGKIERKDFALLCIPFLFISARLFVIPSSTVGSIIGAIVFLVFMLLAHREFVSIEGFSKFQVRRLQLFALLTYVHVTLDLGMILTEQFFPNQSVSNFFYTNIHYPLLYTYFFVFSVFLITDIPQLKQFFRSKELIKNLHDLKGYPEQIELRMREFKPYLKPDVTLETVANQFEINKNTITRVLQVHFNSNFSQYLNKWRVEEFIERSKDDSSKKYDLVGLSKECGFASKASFYRVFKQIKGQTPSEYLENMETN